MNIACSTSFFKNDFPLAARKIADWGFRTIDLIAIKAWGLIDPEKLVSDYDAQRDWIQGTLEAAGLRALSMNFAVVNPADRREAGLNARRIEETTGICRLMQDLGIPRAGFFPGVAAGRDVEAVFADSVDSFKEMVAVGRAHGVVIGPELHKNTPFENIEQSTRLFEAMPDLTIVYDPSHFVMQGIAVEATFPFLLRAHHVHARGSANTRMQCPVADSELDGAWFIRRLQEIGYKEDISIEFLAGNMGGALDPEVEIPLMKAALERALG